MGDENGQLVPAVADTVAVAPPPPASAATAPTAPAGAVARRPAGGVVTANLAAHSYLDEIVQEMTLLNADLDVLNAGLAVLKALSTSLDATIANVDELGKLYEAPEATRSALDADSTVAMFIDQLVGEAQRLGHQVQVLNAQGFLHLRVMRDVQDSQRAMGAGPRLLATAGRL